MARISIATRMKAVELLKRNMSQRQVATELGISRGAVRGIGEKIATAKNVLDRKRSGRPSKLDSRDKRKLMRTSRKNPKLTARQVLSESGVTTLVSVDTAKRILRSGGLRGYVAAKKPALTRKHLKKRLEWSKQHMLWGVEKWENVIFSDESKIELHSNVREYVRRPINERNNPKYTTKTVKFGGGSIMVWGFIKGDGRRKLVKIEGTLNSAKYIEVLKSHLLQDLGDTDIFQQDGAPCHRSRATRQFFTDEAVTVLEDWPAQSPDLNIIESIWAELKKKVRERMPKNLDELWSFCEEEWQKIPLKKIKDLFSSLPRRIEAVIKANGSHTKY